MLKVMIIGAGAIAPAHIEAYLEFTDRAEIIAVANRTVSRAQAIIEKFKLNAVAVSDYKEVLEQVDIVSICTPPGTHREITVTCLNLQKHVLLEKPMAVSLQDCDEILEAEKNNSAVLSVVAQSRFISSISKTINIIHNRNYGRVLFTSVNSLWWRGQNYYDLSWRGLWKTEGGGCTLNHAVHHIDLLIWANGMPVEVTSVMSNLCHDNSEVEDISVSILKYADGTMAQLTCSLLHHGEQQKLNFQMEKAGVSIPMEVTANTPRENGFPLGNEEITEQFKMEYDRLEGYKYEHHKGQVEDFLNCVISGKDPLVDGTSGRETIELIAAVYKSAVTKKTVKLPLCPDDAFYTHEGIIDNTIYFNEKTKFVDAFEDTAITSFKGKF